MNLTPHIETTELNEADLDAVAGGVALAAATNLHLEVGPLSVCADVDALVSAEGVQANAYVGLH